MAEEIEEDKEAKIQKKGQEDQEKPPEEEQIEDKPPKEEPLEEKPPEELLLGEKSPGEEPREEQPVEEEPSKVEPPQEVHPEEQPSEGEQPEEAPSEEEHIEEEPSSEEPLEEEPPVEEPHEEEYLKEEPTEEQPPEKEQHEYVSREEQAEEKSAEEEPSEEQPSEEEHPEEEPPVEEPHEDEFPEEVPPEKEQYEEEFHKEEPTEEEPEEMPPEEEYPEEEPFKEEYHEKEPPEGEPIEKEYEYECPSCGAGISIDMSSCPGCGTELKFKEEEPFEEEPLEEEYPEEESYEEEPYEEEPYEEEPYEEEPYEEEPYKEGLPQEEPPEEEPIEEKYEYECPNCGTGISIDMSSCPGCGTELKFKEEEPFEEEPYEEELPEEEPLEEEPIEEKDEYECPSCGAVISIDMSSCPGCGTELKFEEESPKEESPEVEPPVVGPLDLKEVREYDADELRREIDRERILKEGEKSPEMLLAEIKEERRRLEEERAKLRKEKKQKERVLKKREEKEEEEKPTKKPKTIKSFAKERRKRRELERLRDYLFIGEYLLLVVLVMALLYAEGISFNPVHLPFENSIFLIIVFFLVFKGEKLYLRFLNMKYSGTLQRKVIGVEHYKAVELPPMMLTGFVVAVLLIPITSGIINIVIDMISFDREIIPFSSGFTFKLAMFLLASLIMSIAWVFFLIRYREKVIVPELEKIAEPFVIEDVFIITNSGLLVSHAAIESKPNVDEDILSSMLTAVKEFVKDSFGSSSEEGELDELQYGKVRIIIEYGKHVYLAAVVRGQESMELRPEMKRILKGIQRKFGRTFDTWDGDLGQLKGVDSMAYSLINMS